MELLHSPLIHRLKVHVDANGVWGDPNQLQECVVCMNAPSTQVFPCGHVVCCERCAQRLNKCPMCRRALVEPRRPR